MALLTQKQFAKRKDWSAPYVNRLVKRGIITLTKDGKVDPVKAERALKKHGIGQLRPERTKKLRKKRTAAASAGVGGRPAGGATGTLTSHRAENEKWKAKSAELEYKKAAGELVPRDELVAALQRMVTNFKTNLRKVPRDVALDLAPAMEPSQVEARLLQAIDAVLEELAQDPLGLVVPLDMPVATDDSVQTPAAIVPPNLFALVEQATGGRREGATL